MPLCATCLASAKGRGRDRREVEPPTPIPGKYISPLETTPSLPDVAGPRGPHLIPSVVDTTFAG